MSVQRSVTFLFLFGGLLVLGYLFNQPTHAEVPVKALSEALLADLVTEREVDPDIFEYQPLNSDSEHKDATDEVMIDFLSKLLYPHDSYDVAYVDLLAKSMTSDRVRRELLFVPASEEDSEETAFYIERKPITNREYRDFIRATGRPAPKNWDGLSLNATMKDVPVVNISYEEAAAYAAWAGKRLPTESEIERAVKVNSSFRLGAPVKEWTNTPGEAGCHQQIGSGSTPDETRDSYTGFRLAQ
jgi:hypothetical protein